jgi:prepilin-type N-terminal cleavage/methylation domain-containing protein
MRIRLKCKQGPALGRGNRSERGYTLSEVMVGAAVFGIVATTLCAGFNSGFCLIQSTRENLRATQIMLQKMEAVRLFTWSQVGDTTNYLKSTFTEVYDPMGAAKNCGGPQYTGTVTASVPAVGALPEAYRTNMRTITVSVSWTTYSGTKATKHQREMQTRVARNGMQNYIWGAL